MNKYKEMLDKGWKRFYYGKRVEAPEAMVLDSPQGIKNKWGALKKVYIIWVIWFCKLFMSQTITTTDAIIFLLLMIYGITDTIIGMVLIYRLGTSRFRLDKNITPEMMYSVMKPIFESKYEYMKVDRDAKTGFMTISIKKAPNPISRQYIIRMDGNSTFTVYCKRVGFVFRFRIYAFYKKVISEMGVIVYEMQSVFSVQKSMHLETDKN